MNQPGMTRKQFKAWREWRKWCSVFRVRKPEPTAEEEAAGKVDNIPGDQREQLYLYLADTIRINILSRLRIWHDKQVKWKCPDFTDQEKERFISLFDEWMTGDKKEKAPGFSGNSYKDYIFYCIRKSNDPPGKIIYGKIFNVHGYMDAILIKILRESEDVEFDRGPRGGLRKNPQNREPLDADQSDDESAAPRSSDDLPDNAETVYPDDAEAGKAAFKSLSREEKLILAAASYGVRISNPELLAVLHCKKERAANLRNRLAKRLRDDFFELEESPKARKTMFDLIISDLSAEKETKSFLLSIRNRKEGDCE